MNKSVCNAFNIPQEDEVNNPIIIKPADKEHPIPTQKTGDDAAALLDFPNLQLIYGAGDKIVIVQKGFPSWTPGCLTGIFKEPVTRHEFQADMLSITKTETSTAQKQELINRKTKGFGLSDDFKQKVADYISAQTFENIVIRAEGKSVVVGQGLSQTDLVALEKHILRLTGGIDIEADKEQGHIVELEPLPKQAVEAAVAHAL